MPVSSFSTIRETLRRAIRDNLGLLWDDAALDRVINDAQREYAFLSCAFTGSFAVTATADGAFLCPDDFIRPVKFFGPDGREKQFFRWKYLHDRFPDFRAVTGTEARGVVTDFDGEGRLRLFPRLPAGSAAGTLHYSRMPQKDVLECGNTDAITQHALYQVFLLDGNAAAPVYYNKFISAVNRESHVKRGLAEHTAYRRGRFY